MKDNELSTDFIYRRLGQRCFGFPFSNFSNQRFEERCSHLGFVFSVS